MKNITLSANDTLIKKARNKAQGESTTLNNRFREWLERYVGDNQNVLNEVMENMKYAKSSGAYTREELNER
ncbi:MAG: hypothetical protein GY816_16770 [Cytophagales bacterium]|nr:hypothetical protein [Cytophagales bacterium]